MRIENRIAIYSPTRMGSQLPHRAHERMTSRKPAASTKARKMTAGCGYTGNPPTTGEQSIVRLR